MSSCALDRRGHATVFFFVVVLKLNKFFGNFCNCNIGWLVDDLVANMRVTNGTKQVREGNHCIGVCKCVSECVCE